MAVRNIKEKKKKKKENKGRLFIIIVTHFYLIKNYRNNIFFNTSFLITIINDSGNFLAKIVKKIKYGKFFILTDGNTVYAKVIGNIY